MEKLPENSAHQAALKAARYRLATEPETPVPVDEYAQKTGRPSVSGPPRTPLQFHAQDEAWEVAKTVLDEAFARGDFDNLALSGQNIDHLTSTDDPDWWVKSMMHREQLTGLGPPALTLRVDDQRLEQTLDALPTAAAVRAHLNDFNQRIVEARRQLLGGPPVITKLRSIDGELQAWRERRSALVQPSAESTREPKRRWWARRK
ncbi:DnaJ family domain-containing protein [Glutamicibacter ardleyensis]|uniref:DnaJ homologue subfamily C member 28 conserved domain-containing protein n=1 Tax=Glutamicibacter ardleyensis TaxID=225894 RepID=A0ABQ2D4F8_9MICC|nr:DUF1992 domain-containing protein [Glutamicibacter ardleyensis]GGJ45874.1 hypothetical protein GCM10007173_00420 [Glutamicibacter ardleyensis]